MKLVKREVDFNGAKILAVKENEKIYVGVAYICNNLGMTEGQKKRQILKVQSDETLKTGTKKLRTKIDTQVRELMFIELDYLPLWLAKINPARFNNQLKKKLLEYQLHAKDVLAAAFLNNKPLPTPKEHKIIKKYYNKTPVMSIKDLSIITKSTIFTIHYYAGKNKTIINNYEMVNFKKENPDASERLSHLTILHKEEAINICKKMGVYDRVKDQILDYFDDFIPEAEEILENSPQEPTTDQNTKVEMILKTLPHITDGDLKNHVAMKVLELIDNKILEEYKNNGLHMRFIDSTDEILETYEFNGFKMTLVKTDKPIEEFITLDHSVVKVNGCKFITEKIK